jgi:peptidyl-prolyl cis-trans isomerase C
MKIVIAILMFVLFGAPVNAHGQAEGPSGSDWAAQIGDQTITVAEFLKVLIEQRQAGQVRDVLATLTPEGKERILEQMVEQRLLALAARRQGLTEEADVKQAIEKAVDRVLVEYFLKQELARLDLNEPALEAYYRLNPSEFRSGKRVKARHIITGTTAAAASALQEVREGRKFSEAAAEYNIDSSKTQGGDLGWVKPGVMVKSFDELLFSLEQGEISDVVQTRYGFHIILAEEIDEGRVTPFESVKKQIKQKMISKHLSQVKEKLREIYPVRINRKVLVEPEM